MLARMLAVCAVLLGLAGAGASGAADQASPIIPRTWTDAEMKAFELPLSVPEHSPQHGFRGHDVETRAVRGHRFGLDLTPEEKRALIAFLKTL